MEYVIGLIEAYCDNKGLKFIDDYSGRDMFGKRCIGILCDDPLSELSELFAFIVDTNDRIKGREVQNALGKPRQDSLGMRSILYFPRLSTSKPN